MTREGKGDKGESDGRRERERREMGNGGREGEERGTEVGKRREGIRVGIE